MNPGPTKSSSLTCFHWNLNEIAAHDFAIIFLIQSYALSYNTDIIFLSETFLIFQDILRSDHPSNTKRGSVCMFYKDNLTVIRRDDLFALTKCIVTEIQFGKKSMFFACNYRSPVKIQVFENYGQNFHSTL